MRTFSQILKANFVGEGTKLSDFDLPRVGHRIGVGEDEIHAVIEVETSGGGFNPLKQPKILFEPHVFYRCLPEGKRNGAIAQGLAYKSWKPGVYGKESEQYGKLLRAITIDETAALKACSWGLGQVLGENHIAAGFKTVQDMVVAAVDGGEAAQLEMMVQFIIHNHLDDEIRTHNWAAFARGYNGAQYAKHGYHTRLAAAFAKWAKIPDTVWSPDLDKAVLAKVAVAPEFAQIKTSATVAPASVKTEAPKGSFFSSLSKLFKR